MNRKMRRTAAKRGATPSPAPVAAPAEGRTVTVADALGQAIAFQNGGRYAEAESIYRQILQVNPRHVDALHLLGVLAFQVGKLQTAHDLIVQALSIREDYPDAWSNLGNVYSAAGRVEDAVKALRRAIELRPAFTDAHNNLGCVLERAGRLTEAVAAFSEAVRHRPDNAQALANLGFALTQMGRAQEGLASCRKSVAIDGQYAEGWSNLGNACRALGQIDEAIAAYRRSVSLRPAYAEAWSNLGAGYQSQSRILLSIAAYRHALTLAPNHAAMFSNMLMVANYEPTLTPRQIYEMHLDFGRRFGVPADRIPAHPNSRDPGRRLRVGYISGDLMDHPVAHYIEPVLSSHDPAAVEVFCYSETPRHDKISERLKSLVPHWRQTLGSSDAALIQQIRGDAIDILVDLSGHTGRNRLTALAHKPAPVQIGWIGYLNTTGLPAIDYILADPHLIAPEDDGLFLETVWRLPRTTYCYRPMVDPPPVAPAPALARGVVTFGCYNNPSKISRDVVLAWTRILHAVPGSRIILKYRTFADRSVQALFLSWFAEGGIGPERVEFRGLSPFREFLDSFADIDLALDPFPYSGVTTTFHTLWMGVPVVTMEGKTPMQRFGTSALHALGLSEWIATNPDAYVDLAVSLASDTPALAALRAGTRGRIMASAFFDYTGFTRDLEAAYRGMWQRWCAGTPGR